MSRASICLFFVLILVCSRETLSVESQELTFEHILYKAKVVFVGKPDQPFMTKEWESGEQGGRKYRMQLTFYNYIVSEQIVGEKVLQLTRGQKLKVRAPNSMRDIDVAQIASQGGMEMPEYWEYKSPCSGQKGSILYFDLKSSRVVYLSGDPLEILGEDLAKYVDEVKKRFESSRRKEKSG